jgi:hypothetical protein
MPSRGPIAFLAVALAGVVALAVVAARDQRDLAFTLGVAPGLVAAELGPREAACQVPVPVATEFDGVTAQFGTYHRPGPPVAVSVETFEGGRSLASGRLPGGYPDFSRQRVPLDATVAAGERVAVCVHNLGRRKLALYGGPELARRGSTVEIDGRDQGTDLTLFFTTDSRSAAALLPEVFDRASLFRPAWVGPWTFWLLGALLLLAVPALLTLALVATARSEHFSAD